MARKVGSKIFVWILLAMIIVGLIGFGSTNLGGTVRSIGTVGEKDLSINAYARALQNELRSLEAQTGQPISFGQAQLFGVDQQVLSRVVSSRLLDSEADRLGISVGDEILREQLLEVPNFQGIDGAFDREMYQLALENAGLNEREYETQLRDEISSSLLQTSLLGNLQTNPAYAKAFAAYLTEQRDITWAQLSAADLDAPISSPSETDLTSFYESNIDAYTLPETRQITYVWMTPDMLIDTVELDEQSLKDAYDRRESEFNTPERRLVERLVFSDTASAQAAADRLASGDVTFEELVIERGLALSDIDLGDVGKSELGAAGDAVFAHDGLGVVGPAQSDLGAALFRVNGVLTAQSTTFDEALPLLRDELAYDRARRVIDAQVTDLEDLLAAGATLEELATDTEMQLGSIGYHSGVFEGIAGYAAFRNEASLVSTDDFPAIANLADGGIFAMRLDAIDAARPEEFENVRLDVAEGWAAQQQLRALAAKAAEIVTDVSGGAGFEDSGLTANVEVSLGRRARPEGIPTDITTQAFELDQAGETIVVESTDAIYVLRLDAIHAADLESDDNKALIAAVEQQNVSALDQDVFQSFANAVRLRTDIEINQQAINAVHANFQ